MSAGLSKGQKGTVLVVGSINRDITLGVDRLPATGETVLGTSVAYGLGGKGANQAVAAARAGARTKLLATVGADLHGVELCRSLSEFNVDTSLVAVDDDEPSGTAYITVDSNGENSIVVMTGANRATTPLRVEEAAGAIVGADVVVAQGEIPQATIASLAETLAERPDALFVLNLAPFVWLPDESLHRVNVLVVNESELAHLLTTLPPNGPEEARNAARQLLGDVGAVVVSLGQQGAVVVDREGLEAHVPVPLIGRVVDTTGAGDALVGVLAAGLADGMSLQTAVRAAVSAATQTVEAVGAAPSYPHFDLRLGQ